MTLTSDKCALIILDGCGIGDDDSSNAIAAAHTPFMDELLRQHPKATLRTDGEHVGLPDGQMGNIEVGHMWPTSLLPICPSGVPTCSPSVRSVALGC